VRSRAFRRSLSSRSSPGDVLVRSDPSLERPEEAEDEVEDDTPPDEGQEEEQARRVDEVQVHVIPG
jgi:hypothetical protein